MIERIQAIRGMNDILPHQTSTLQDVEQRFARCLQSYGYDEIRFPLLESTQLFKRTIGDQTDIVAKEMYTFLDLNQESISLRPEGTAGCIRACLEHGLLHNQQQKLWYKGPMFRYEKPQKGRYRQFHQFGVEVLGLAGVGIELELLLICQRLWSLLGVQDGLQLQINTLGTAEERQAYRQVLTAYYTQHSAALDDTSRQRLQRSPIRILDSKNPLLSEINAQAPQLMDNLGAASLQHFTNLTAGLDALGIAYQVNPRLVRGLDYYGHTVFEWVSDRLGAQSAVCAGGRYDGLVEQLGGVATPAVGFGIGIERLLLLMERADTPSLQRKSVDIFMILEEETYLTVALALAEKIRQECGLVVVTYLGHASFKSQFKKADKSGARLALILGQQEQEQGMISLKDLRQGVQQSVAQTALIPLLAHYFDGEER